MGDLYSIYHWSVVYVIYFTISFLIVITCILVIVFLIEVIRRENSKRKMIKKMKIINRR